jgi:tetraprenyl-beta-curcumene synthase
MFAYILRGWLGRATGALAEALMSVWVLARYWSLVVPVARREIARWSTRALLIPDATLREYAVGTLEGEALNAEAATVFALLAPRRHRRTVTRLTVTYQLLYDYLDTLTEQPVQEMVSVGLRLHRALIVALEKPAKEGTPERIHPLALGDDGGYLAALVRACQAEFVCLPSAGSVRDVVRRAAWRCGEAQTYTHASAVVGRDALVGWARRETETHGGYYWWELAAGGISSLGIHALLATAASAQVPAAELAAIDAAYFPSVCAISTLLDSLVDRIQDRASGNLNYVSEYSNDLVAARRLRAIADEATEQVAVLRGAQTHRVIVAGVAGFYLSAAEARSDDAAKVAAAVVDGFGPAIFPILVTLRMRRAVKARRRDQEELC